MKSRRQGSIPVSADAPPAPVRRRSGARGAVAVSAAPPAWHDAAPGADDWDGLCAEEHHAHAAAHCEIGDDRIVRRYRGHPA